MIGRCPAAALAVRRPIIEAGRLSIDDYEKKTISELLPAYGETNQARKKLSKSDGDALPA